MWHKELFQEILGATEEQTNVLLTMTAIQETILATLSDLNAAINALPDATTTAVVTALQPVLAAIEAQGTGGAPLDTQAQIDALSKVPAIVAANVAAAITGTGVPPPVVTNNSDGSVTTVTTRADGTKTSETVHPDGTTTTP